MKRFILIFSFGFVLLFILGIGIYFNVSESKGVKVVLEKEENYSATQILENVNFNVENPSVELKMIDTETEDVFNLVELTNETQQELIMAFKNSEFKKADSQVFDYNFRIKITLNTGYVMYLDTNKNALTFYDTTEHYFITGDKTFFSILEKIVSK